MNAVVEEHVSSENVHSGIVHDGVGRPISLTLINKPWNKFKLFKK